MSINVQSNDAAADAVVNKSAEAKVEAPKDETPAALEATATEQNAAEVSETEETEVEKVESEKDAEVEASEEEAAAEDKGKKPGKKSGFQRRIDKLNAAKAAAQQEVEYWKQEAFKRATESKKDAPKLDSKPAAAEGEPQPENFDTHAAYVKATARWEAKQALDERDQKMEKSKLEVEQAKTQKSFNDRLNAFREKTPDFDEVAESMEDVPRSAALEAIIVESENGPELYYELAKDPKEAKRIAKLPPFAAAREIGKIEERLALKSASAPKKVTKTTTAPAPITPVGGGGRATAPPKTLEEAASHSFAEYRRVREEQLKSRRQA